MGPDSREEPTLPINLNTSDPIEMARKHRDEHHSEDIPDKIGPYKVLAYLGGGGMGLVYLAEQGTPARRVAIKIIPPHRRTKDILGRFDIEREALALMDHPNIAKVFGAGESDDGRPYFVMEYVHGIPITEYCDKNKLTTNQRLELFVDVCRAVHHAHQKGVIHRDIKPSNVLVSIQEDHPTPKVIDFGVAKAVGHQLTQRTIFTEQGQLIGTPGYMSPEQAEMNALDIDTRTDIYSLGVLLYELLVGAQPFDTHELLAAGFGEIQRVIREVDPPKPSTKLSSMGDDSTAVASNRHTAVRSLSRELRGDLDWITMKCLEKDRTRRYDSATALAQDIEHHLKAEPVLAGPPSAIYRMHKFTRRHRFGVAAGLGITAALIAGFVGTAMQYLRADREWIRAEEKAKTAAEITDFMIGLFKVSDPSEALGNTIPARVILDRGADRIRKQLTDRPFVQAAMMDAIGNVYGNLGLYKEAEDLLRKAVAIRKKELVVPDAETAAALHHLGDVLDRKGEYQESEKYHLEGLVICERLFGRESIPTSESLTYVAGVEFDQDRRDKSEQLLQEVLSIRRKLLPGNDPRVAAALMEVGRIAHSQSEIDVAKRVYDEALGINMRSLGRNHPQTVECKRFLAHLAYKRDELDESLRLYDEVLGLLRVLYGNEDTHVAACMNNYATVLAAKKEYDQAEEMALKALDINRKCLGPVHPQVASDLNLLGAIARGKGEFSRAEKYHRDSLEMRLKLHGPNHEMVGSSRLMLGVCLAEMARYEESEQEMLGAIRIFELSEGDKSRIQDAHERIAKLYSLWGRPEEAARYQRILEQRGNQ